MAFYKSGSDNPSLVSTTESFLLKPLLQVQSACLGVSGIEKAPRLNAAVLAFLSLAGISCFIQFTDATEKGKKGEFLPFRFSFSTGSPCADSLFLK